MEAVTFRRATLLDVETLVELRQQQLQEDGAVPEYDLGPHLAEYFTENLNSDAFVCWLAVQGRVIATAGIAFYKVPPYYANANGLIGQIANVYTAKEHRRRGLASELLNRVIAEARRVNCTAIRVSASEMGKLLYRAHGFTAKTNMFELKL